MQAGAKTAEPRRPRVVAVPTVFRLSPGSSPLPKCYIFPSSPISFPLEWGAAMMGANRFQIFRRVLLPLTLPGLLTAGILVLVNTVSNFELTFLVSGAGSQTLVVALFYNVFAGGVRPVYSVDAMAVMYMTMIMVLLLIALRFVRPTQMVFRLDQPKR